MGTNCVPLVEELFSFFLSETDRWMERQTNGQISQKQYDPSAFSKLGGIKSSNVCFS